MNRRMVTALIGSATAAALLVSPISAGRASAAPATSWDVASPDGSITAHVALDDGRLALTSSSRGSTMVTARDLGIITDADDLSSGLVVDGARTTQLRSSYTTLTGKSRERSVDQRQLQLRVHSESGTPMTVQVRAADDGIAFRYVVAGKAAYSVLREPVTFGLPSDADAWEQPYNAWYENEHVQTTAAGAATGDVGFPATFRTTGRRYMLLTESDVTGTYAGSHLTHITGSPDYGLALYEDYPVQASGTLTTPWRVEILGSAATLVESTLVDDLAPATKVRDTSWIHPGASAWSWLSNPSSAQGDLAVQERYVDLAATEGWSYALVDEGWQASWMPELVRYAQARGVNILAWFNSAELQTPQQQETVFDQLNRWGVAGLKVDFMNSDSQKTFQFYDSMFALTAKHHLMVNFHGATIPKGLQRTWPQVISYEAVRGEENGRSAVRDTILPFTRNVVGSMDFTPTVLTGNTETSKAHELALPVVYESGWTHLADSPQAYAAQPSAAAYLAGLPTVWDETRYVSGAPGEDAVIARRAGERWFIGGIRSGGQATMTVPLTMLDRRSWLIDLVTDDGGSLAHTTLIRTSADTLAIPTVAHGGFAIQACPAAPGRTTCLTNVTRVPRTTMLVDADRDSANTGDVVTVQGVFVVRSDGPVKNVRMTVDTPPTWRVLSGGTLTRDSLADGETLTGTWRVRVGGGGQRGALDLPIAATFTTPDGRSIRSAAAAALVIAQLPLRGDVYLSDAPFETATSDYGAIQRDTDLRGDAIRIGPDPATYAKGIVANANAVVTVALDQRCSSLSAVIGVDPDGDDPDQASVTFQALGDNGTVLGSIGSDASPITASTAPMRVEVPTQGVSVLTLKIDDAGDGINNDHGAIADAVLHCAA